MWLIKIGQNDKMDQYFSTDIRWDIYHVAKCKKNDEISVNVETQ